jgi:predicted small secreted protein
MKAIRLMSFALLGALALSAVGCATTEGFGEDLQRGGRKISQEAREHR